MIRAKRIYVGGPMSNYAQFNVPAFLEAQEDLIGRGYDAILPVDMDVPSERKKLLASKDGREPCVRSWATLLSEDLKLIGDTGIEGIVVLPGWHKSRGARLECFFACLLQLPIYNYPSLRRVSSSTLQEVFGEINGT